MQLHLVLAATLAAFFVVGCSSEKSTSPIALASTGPQEKPSVEPSHETSAPPPRAELPPSATASLPAQPEDPATNNPPAPPDPWAGIDVEWVPVYKDFAKLLEPIVKAGGAAVQAGFQPRLSEDEQRWFAMRQLGQCKVPLNREQETRLRALLAKARATETETERYLAAADSLLREAYMLAAAYEQAIDEGADIPAETRQKLTALIRSKAPQEASPRYPAVDWETALLEQSVRGDALFALAVGIHRGGESVIEKRHLTRMFYDLVTALPEPHRTDVLVQITRTSEQEAAYDKERESLKRPSLNDMNLTFRWVGHANRARYLTELAPKLRPKFLALEQARRDTIEEFFPNVDAPGWYALVTLDALFAELQGILDNIKVKVQIKSLPDLNYGLQPLLPANAPRDAASNVLAKITLSGSANDRVPTTSVYQENFQELLVFDAPAGHPTYADVLKPGNVLVGTFRLNEAGATTHHAELHIRNAEKDYLHRDDPRKAVQGEMVIETPANPRKSLPFQGAIRPTGFSFEVQWDWKSGTPRVLTFAGSLDKGGPLIGGVQCGYQTVREFSFTLKK